ncbi:hypothetical protein EYC84_012026 [Monilinia fructicola]|uniref:Uncharacterized protein n=2 Tax=Monilinia fructicola TaxID=38448 RepID=A0A5M9J6G2_MONFR|nr:hypothetical protein EYC84_012026 [Monilinia fructicola]
MDNKKSKTSYQLDTPFTAVQWPEISSKDQETIVELLCSILSPIGIHRSNHITPSKGKRSKKRKRRASKSGEDKSSESPPPPEISPYIITGLNSIHRMLEASVKKAPETTQAIGMPTPKSTNFPPPLPNPPTSQPSSSPAPPPPQSSAPTSLNSSPQPPKHTPPKPLQKSCPYPKAPRPE